LNNEDDCEKLFSLFPNKVAKLNKLYKASENNFQISQFHSKCDGI